MPNEPPTTGCPRTRYRPSIPVPAEIRNHCHIYLDEQLYISALTLLTDLVTSGSSHPQHLDSPAFAPIPFHIEIVSALVVHPRHTTHTRRGERVDVAWRALTFLRSLLATLGPRNGNLGEAFSLSPFRTRGARRGRIADDGSSESGGEDEAMGGVVANQGRIRRSAKDFWHIVGWAFNCSVAYPKRWKYWKAWLGYMLDVLDADWEEREADDTDAGIGSLESTQGSDMSRSMLHESLLVKYLADTNGRSSGVKMVVAAVFAAGSPQDLRTYPEVFPNEMREPEAQNRQKRKRVDSIKPEFGGFTGLDVLDIDDMAFNSSPPTDQAPDSSQNSVEEDVVTDPWMAYPESIVLRQRILAMLSRLAATLPETFIDYHELYEIYCVHAKSLPLPPFSLLFTPSALSALPSAAFVSLGRLLLLRLSASSSSRVRVDDAEGISPGALERCILPCVAATSSTADNARVSILVESLFRLFLKTCIASRTTALVGAVEKGVRAREAKAKIDRRRRDGGGGERDREWLEASGGRLRRLVEWAGGDGGGDA